MDSSQGQPLDNHNGHRLGQGTAGGYGLSAGMKIGRPPSAVQSNNQEGRLGGFNGPQF